MEVRSFLGFVNFYSWLLKGYALVTHPVVRVGFRRKCKQEKQASGTVGLNSAREAFQKIKDLCCTAPILAFTGL